MSLVKVDFYTHTGDAWRIMLRDIKDAKHTIVLEQYIFMIDTIGHQFIEALREKVRQGVRVRLLCDMVGSYSFYTSHLPDFLRKQGFEVRFFNPIKPWRITNFTSNFFRDHRKILIIDNEVAHLGGVGIQEHMEHWRDTHMRLAGPIIENIKESFETVWQGVKMGFYIRYKKSLPFIRKYDLLINAPSLKQRYIHQELIFRIRNATKYIYLTTPYFIPDVRLYRALRVAAKKGVDVRILVPEVADHAFVNHARESYFTLALKAGIKIFVYTPEMMHAKTAVIDDYWATAGSFNLDSLSFYFNHEANIASLDPLFINELKNHFFHDLTKCREVTFEVWVKRPWRKKFLELLTWPFHGIM
jgi:cardiolipin synthase A/B